MENYIWRMIDEVIRENILTCAKCSQISTSIMILVQDVGNVCQECHARTPSSGGVVEIANSDVKKVIDLLQIIECRRGCKNAFHKQKELQHDNECEFRMVDCIHPSECLWSGRVADLAQHFLESHVDSVLYNRFNEFTFDLGANVADFKFAKLLIKNETNQIFARLEKTRSTGDFMFLLCAALPNCGKIETKFIIERVSDNWDFIHKTSPRPLSDVVCFNTAATRIIMSEYNCSFTFNETKVVVKSTDKADRRSFFMTAFRVFRCCICAEVMQPPIYGCNQSHSFCMHCNDRIKTCPICRSVLPQRLRVRNYAIENFLKYTYYYFCRYNCKSCYTMAALELHEIACSNRPIQCPVFNCQFSGVFRQFAHHIADNEHSLIVTTLGPTRSAFLELPTGSPIRAYTCSYFFYDSNVFKFNIRYSNNNCTMYVKMREGYHMRYNYDFQIKFVDYRVPQRQLIMVTRCIGDNTLKDSCLMLFPCKDLEDYANPESREVQMYCKIIKVRL